MPPSAIKGTPVPSRAAATSATALICGTPTPATIRVVQIEPGPIPTLTPSAPASASALAAEPVAMLPPITCSSGKVSFAQRTRSITPLEWPCAVSTITTSTPALTSAVIRSGVSGPVPTAAPTRSCPSLSLQAFGCSCALLMSFTVIRPAKPPLSLTTNNFSMRLTCSSFSITSRLSPVLTVISLSLVVITSDTLRFMSLAKRTSRPVTIPTSSLPSTTGTPEILFC